MDGPVAQLGARFHGMEEVDGSNPSRSTKTFHILTGTLQTENQPLESTPESKPKLMHGYLWAVCGFLTLPTVRTTDSTI